jgi:hypothetical protein
MSGEMWPWVRETFSSGSQAFRCGYHRSGKPDNGTGILEEVGICQ